MGAPDTNDTDNSGRATLRDVWTSQKETRAELADVRTDLGNRMDQLSEKVDTVVTAQEHRVTILETVSLQHTGTLASHESRLGVLEIAHQRALGHLSAWRIGGAVFGGAASIVLADLIYRALGG